MTSVGRFLWWGAVLLLLIWTPLPIGSVNPEWSMPLTAACMLLGVLRALVVPLIRRERIDAPVQLVPLLIFVALIAVQLAPLPREVVGIISPERLAVPGSGAEGGALALSVYPGTTFEQGLLHVGLLYLLWGILVRPSRNAFRVLALAGFVHATLALVLAQTGGTHSTGVLWVYELPEVLTPFGTYVNKNHFAGLMVIAAGACLAILLRRLAFALRRVSDLHWRAQVLSITGRGSFRLVVPLIGLVVISIALFASGSRGGALAFALAMLGTPVLAMCLARRFRFRYLAPVIILVAGAAVLGTAGDSVSVVERLQPTGRYMNRPRLWANTLDMATRYPLVGTGLGTFAYVFPKYQEFAPDRFFTHAEGDWVQYLAETGLAGAVALLAFAYVLGRRVVPSLKRGGERAALLTGGMAGLMGIVAQGFVDVSLHIPANMLAATILLGGLLAQSADPVESPGKGDDR